MIIAMIIAMINAMIIAMIITMRISYDMQGHQQEFLSMGFSLMKHLGVYWRSICKEPLR